MRRALGFAILAGIVYAVGSGGKQNRAPEAPAAPNATTYPALPQVSTTGPITRHETSGGVLSSWPDAPRPAAPPLQVASTAPANEAIPAAAAPLPAAPALNPPLAPEGVVRRRDVRLRSAPGGRALKGAAIRKGAKALELKRVRGWRQVELEDGRRGWIAAKAFETPATPP